MYESLKMFDQATRTWFLSTFGSPTDVQDHAWPVIQEHKNVLVVAPTGSGKTLAAFLSQIDALMHQNRRKKGVKTLYISPLKALGVDVAKNLRAPLEGIRQEASRLGQHIPQISIGMRSGDTSAQERRGLVSHPPDILVTTPESLYLMLTSKAASTLSTVETVIIDEVHAIAGSKRGAHLALSLERLDALLDHPAQRIGLSATVTPLHVAASFLGGSHPVTIVNSEQAPQFDITVVEPVAHMHDTALNTTATSTQPISGVTPAMMRLANKQGAQDAQDVQSDTGTGNSVWPYVQRSVLDQILAHKTTLVFVNSRGLAERFTAQLNDLYAKERGVDSSQVQEPAHYRSSFGSSSMLVGTQTPQNSIAMAHHGSVSKERRKQIEEQLKRGQLRCVVATSSLELGIDMGSVDLVIQIAPPMSVSSGLQRIGRADHHVGGVSRALLYPLTREQIISAGAIVECMKEGRIEPITIIQNPIDILAQHTVAAAARTPLHVDQWYTTVRKAAPYSSLDRQTFNSVISMLTGAYNSEDFSAFRPPLQYDDQQGYISARPGALRLAVTSGGTIPDRGLYSVVLPESEAGSGRRKVGELDEEMVYESRVGDIITLGTSTWQIQQITNDRVTVTPAPGRSARLPFWHGEGNGQDYSYALAQAQWVRSIHHGLASRQGNPQFDKPTYSRLTQDGLDANAIDNLANLLATQEASTQVIPNDMHLVIEQCADEEGDWRIIIHAPFGRRVLEPWALAINAKLTQRYGFEGQIFATDDGIVLRVPQTEGSIDFASIIAFDSDDIIDIVRSQVSQSVLFAARFRECAARALFMPRTDPRKRVPLWQQRLRAAQLLTAARTYKNFPLLLETARECLQDVYDLPHLQEVLQRLNNGTISVHTVETSVPSPMAQHMLFGFIGSVMYQYDVPQAERNAQLLAMDSEVLERLLGTQDAARVLNTTVIDEVRQELASRTFWNELQEDDVTGRVTRYAKTHGPFTAQEMIHDLSLDAEQAIRALDEGKARGTLMSGRFDERMPQQVTQWLHKSVFQMLKNRSLAQARKAIRPVTVDTFQSFVISRQGVGPVGGELYEGIDGLMRVIEQLEGVALPVDVWQHYVFPARIRNYDPSMLDELVSSGEVVWVGASYNAGLCEIMLYPVDSLQLAAHCKQAVEQYPCKTQEITLQSLILQVFDTNDGAAFSSMQIEKIVRPQWQANGPQMVNPQTGELVASVWSSAQFEEALWDLVWKGLITNSSCAVIRARAQGKSMRRSSSAHGRVRLHSVQPQTMAGLWSKLDTAAEEISAEQFAIDTVSLLLDRYGVVVQPLVEMANIKGGFSSVYPVLKAMEERGDLVRGMFIEGMGAAQFANKETINMLREARHHHNQSCVALDVTDPANLVGGAIQWPTIAVSKEQKTAKPMRKSGSIIVLRHGESILYAAIRSGKLVAFTDIETLVEPACAELAYSLSRNASSSITFSECNGKKLVIGSAITSPLRKAGFTFTPQGMKLYR